MNGQYCQELILHNCLIFQRVIAFLFYEVIKTDFAIQNEKELDFITNHRVPQSTGTHVYRLIEEIKSFIE